MNCQLNCKLARTAVLLIALTFVSGLQADPRLWDPAGIAIRQGAGIGSHCVVQNDENNTLVVWCDLRSGSEDLFAQLISPSGVPLWEPEGKLVAGGPWGSVNPVAVAVADGWIIFWMDHRLDCGMSDDPVFGDIYAQKIDLNGNRQWLDNDQTGVCVDTYTSRIDHMNPLIAVPDGSGGAMVAWVDFRDYEHGEIYVQRIDAGGTVQWASPLLAADSSVVHSETMSGCGDGTGNLILGWNNGYEGTLICKVTPAGLRPWGNRGQQLRAGYHLGGESMRLCPDGSGGCYVAWTGRTTDTGPSLHAQRVNAAGAALWTSGGIDVCTNLYTPHFSVAPSVNADSTDGVLLSWTNDDYMNPQIYSQKISASGQILWTQNGLLTGADPCGGANSFFRGHPIAMSDHAGGMICFWLENLAEGISISGDIYATRIGPSGVKTWGGDCNPVCAAPSSQEAFLPILAPNGAFVFWIDIASDLTTLRYQLVNVANGNLLLNENTSILHSGICAQAENPRIIAVSPGHAAVVWEDTRSWTGRKLYYRMIDAAGHLSPDANGRLLTPAFANVNDAWQSNAQLCSDGSGGFWAVGVHSDNRSEMSCARLTHVNANGDVVSPDSGIMVGVSYLGYGVESAMCVPDGMGGCYVAWVSYNEEFILTIQVNRYNASGQPQWSTPRQFDGGAYTNELDGMLAMAENRCAIVWGFGSSYDRPLFCSYLNSDGSLHWQTMVDPENGRHRDVQIIADNNGGLYCAWQTQYSDFTDYVVVQHLDGQGQRLWSDTGMIVGTADEECYYPRLSKDRHGNLYVAWLEHGNQWRGWFYLQKISPSGIVLWETRGRAFCANTQGERSGLRLYPDKGDGVFAFWNERTNLRRHIFGTHLDSEGSPFADPYWTPNGALISTSWDEQYDPVICDDGEGGVIVAYVDNKGVDVVIEPPQIYAQRIYDGYTDADERPIAATDYALNQNFPNPFNPATEISFELAQSGLAKLEVFDLLGRYVTTLVNGNLSAGAHQVRFDGANLPSGTYIYRLQSADFSQSRKMLLLK